jgi:predicted enzyme related to lactoylglutathione lyase
MSFGPASGLTRVDTLQTPRALGQKGDTVGQPVVHFEIIGKDSEKLRSYYSELFGWEFDANNPVNYGLVQREGNVNADGIGIGGGVGGGPEGYAGHVTFYVEVPDVEAALAKAESLGGERMMGPEKVMEQVEVGLFNDPEGHIVGVVKSVS